jgi:hypothetical protein
LWSITVYGLLPSRGSITLRTAKLRGYYIANYLVVEALYGGLLNCGTIKL